MVLIDLSVRLDYFLQVTHELDEPFSKHLQSPHECFERWFMALAETKLLPMISPLFPWTVSLWVRARNLS